MSGVELASLVFASLGIISKFLTSTLSNEPSRLYDTTRTWQPLLSPKDNFIEVFDIPFSPGKSAKLHLKAINVRNLDDVLKAVPVQEEGFVRVCFAENLNVLNSSAVAVPAFAGCSPMISQWNSSSKPTRWETYSYKLSPPQPMYRVAEKSFYVDSLSMAAGTIRRTLRCMIDSTDNNRMILYIDATSMIQRLDILFDEIHLREHVVPKLSSEAAYAYHDQFCSDLQSPIQIYPTLGVQIASASGLKQLILLRYCHALIEDYSNLIYPLRADYAKRKEGLSDTRRTTLTMSMLKEIIRDAFFYEEVTERAAELARSVNTLVECLKPLLGGAMNFPGFQCLAVELQSTCTDMEKIAVTMSATLDNHLRLFELSRGMHEAQSVRLLSILASIFLPLSLACGLLSMQTRFIDLHVLLYDFFGVLVLLGTIVIAILIVLRLHQWWKVLLSQLDRDQMFRRYVRPKGHIVFLCFLFLGWALLLSSFLVGMIKDVDLGLKILGYGVSAAAGICFVALIGIAGIAISVWLIV
ncbi:hypothetical protein P153DRAFT_96699 [Dothidotthia symphoricarpi CBS 119687]|uniref:Uncharacterized protein n=1 Tax=Dothidotthia symphoricarpi CBS 119687 TaxID=1392245 RepID=A0A6A6APF1_9PLEO|nr:uncharacterized protein P153DRAFT_96699 [Dothidotthia symphoricarpi CBS 119687]KAF2133670.1 hypothetical protein P153DRAFT_96699 [Dothidotthia symphoricarpi CBS 119687]